MTLSVLTVTAVPAPAAGLPLRHDDVLSMALLLKVLLVTGLLLLCAYLVLRFYARRQGGVLAAPAEPPPLQCHSALRLSTRTRVYLVQVGATRVLVTESGNGSQSLVLPDATLPSAPTSPLASATTPASASASGPTPASGKEPS